MAPKVVNLGYDPDESPLDRMVEGKPVERHGIHLIGTPDTQTLTQSIAKKIQALLDISHDKNPDYYPKKNVSYSILNKYEFFGSEDPIPTIPSSVSGANTWVISDPHGDEEIFNKQTKTYKKGSSNDKYQHDKLLLEAVRKNGSHTTNMIMSAFYGARQDKATEGKRQTTTVTRTGKELSDIVGAEGRIWTLDLHNPVSEEHLGNRPVNFYTRWLILEAAEILGLNIEKVMLLPADEGGIKRMSGISDKIGCSTAKVIKARDCEEGGDIRTMDIIGDIEGTDVIVHDDILDSGSTLCTLLKELLLENPKSISVVITHGMFNNGAIEKLRDVIENSKGKIKKVFVSDSINKIDLPEWIHVLSTDQLYANAITHVSQGFRNLDKGDAKNRIPEAA